MHQADVAYTTMSPSALPLGEARFRPCRRSSALSYVPGACSVRRNYLGLRSFVVQVTRHPEPATGAVHPHEVHRAVRLSAMASTGSSSSIDSAGGAYTLRVISTRLQKHVARC